MKTPQNTAAAACPGSRCSVSSVATSRRRGWNQRLVFRLGIAVFGRNHGQFPSGHDLVAGMNGPLNVRHRASFRQLSGFDAKFRARPHPLEKLEPVDSGEHRNALGFGQPGHHHTCGLRHRFDEEYAGNDRLAGKMAGKERFGRINELQGNAAHAGFQFRDLIDPQERRTMRNQAFDLASVHHFGLYTLNISALIFGFTSVIWMSNTLFTPLLPSTPSVRSRKLSLRSLTIT